MFDVMSVREAAKKWEISERRVQKLCETERIPGAERFGRSWMIPTDAEKPSDLRKKGAKKPPRKQTCRNSQTDPNGAAQQNAQTR